MSDHAGNSNGDADAARDSSTVARGELVQLAEQLEDALSKGRPTVRDNRTLAKFVFELASLCERYFAEFDDIHPLEIAGALDLTRADIVNRVIVSVNEKRPGVALKAHANGTRIPPPDGSESGDCPPPPFVDDDGEAQSGAAPAGD